MMRLHPTVEIPQWQQPSEDPTADSPYCIHEAITALQRYLPSNSLGQPDNPDPEIDAYSCDHFRMYEFKVRRCVRGRSHDWTECPYAHPGEKARRRDPRKYHYSGTACPDYRKGCCKKGELCEYAHGVFECWLHPLRYRTQPCKDGVNCTRRVCFFAHSPDQLRVVDNSPESSFLKSSSPIKGKRLSFSGAGDESSPPGSPMRLSRSVESNSMSEVLGCLRSLQLSGNGNGKGKSLLMSPSYGSPRGGAMMRSGFCSLPSTPTGCLGNNYGLRGGGVFDSVCEEEPVMERVESGRDLRMKMFERISKGSSLERVDDPDPDVGWVSDLLK